jgi:hypothetical protein
MVLLLKRTRAGCARQEYRGEPANWKIDRAEYAWSAHRKSAAAADKEATA